MGKCKDCRFWTPGKPREVPDGFGYCGSGRIQYRDFPENEIKPKDRVIFCDSERYHAWLYTHQAFGCIYHKPKEVIE